jgi:hypothetical protein
MTRRSQLTVGHVDRKQRNRFPAALGAHGRGVLRRSSSGLTFRFSRGGSGSHRPPTAASGC